MSEKATDWSNLAPRALGEREEHPRGMRWPRDLAAGVQKLADESGQDFSTMALYLMRAALGEATAAKKANGAKPSSARS